MDNKRKVCVITAGRADYIRIKTALDAINNNDALELQLCVMGSHLLNRFGLTINTIIEDGFKVDEKIFIMLEGEDPLIMTKSIGLGIIEVSTALNNLKPDIVIALTDRFEALITSVAAATMNIPLVHLQGGEVSGTIDESIRHVCTKFANWHLASTEDAKKRIIKLGEPKSTVFNTGCPSIDLLKQVEILTKSVLFEKVNTFSRENFNIDNNKQFILVLQHPVTTELDDNYNNMKETLKAIYQTNIQTIMLWPNIDTGGSSMVKAIRYFLMENPNNKIFLFKHFPYDIFVNLMYHCNCMIGNSSASIRETPCLGTPVVDIGTRESGRERGKNTINVHYNSNEISSAIHHQLNHGRYEIEEIFGDGISGEKIAKILTEIDLSYIQKKISY